MKKNYEYISFLSIISCIAVVMLHTNGVFWKFDNSRYWITANVIESVMYFAVPIFFMISGATLLDYREKYSTSVYFKKRIDKVLIPFIFWSVIGVLYKFVRNPSVFDGKNVFSIVNMILNTDIITIYWFFIPLFSIYLSIPVLSAIPKELKKEVYKYLAIVSFITVSLLPFIFSLIGFEYNNSLKISCGVGYIFYVVVGYYISHYEISKKDRIVIYIFSIIGLLLHLFGTMFLSLENGEIIKLFKGYMNVPCILYSIGIFVFIKYEYQKINMKLTKLILKLKNYTFGIYLLHYYIMNEMVLLFSINTRNIFYRLFSPLIIISFCVIIINIFRKIPVLKKFVP